MAELIERKRLAEAWLGAMELLLERGGKSFHLDVAFPAAYEAGSAPWEEINGFLIEHKKWDLSTVVNTIFPESLYIPELGEEAAARLYESYEMSMRVHQRVGKRNDKETYFNRLVSYPVATGSTEKLSEKAREMLKEDGSWNQLEFYIERLRTQRQKTRRRSSYEIGLSHPLDAEMRVQAPGRDLRTGSFPCLSHVSLTLVDDRVNLNATYRNQYLVTRGFGNYVGLARLTEFIAAECGAQPGEVQVVATGADPEIEAFGVGKLKALVERCGEAIGSESGAEEVTIGG
jgi:hypothetical protein